MSDFYIPIMYISGYSIFIPIIAGLIKFKALSQVQRVLFFYLIIAALTEVASLTLRTQNEKTLQAIQNVFTIAEYFFIFTLFYLELHFKVLRIFIVGMCIICLAIFCASFYNFNLLFFRNDFTTTIESVFVIVLSVIFFFIKINADHKKPELIEYPFFWIATALAVYFATALVIFVKNSYLVEHADEFRFYHTMQRLINILSNILFTIGLCCRKR